MERMAWTDERLDDLARRMDAGFDRVDADIRELRGEMRDGFSELRAEIAALRLMMFRFGGGMMIALAGLIASDFLRA